MALLLILVSQSKSYCITVTTAKRHYGSKPKRLFIPSSNFKKISGLLIISVHHIFLVSIKQAKRHEVWSQRRNSFFFSRRKNAVDFFLENGRSRSIEQISKEKK